MAAVGRRRDARQLCVRVVHMKYFVAENLFEDRTRVRVIVHELAIDRKPSGRGFLRHVQEGEEAMIRLAVDAKVVEAVAAG